MAWTHVIAGATLWLLIQMPLGIAIGNYIKRTGDRYPVAGET